MPSHCMFPFVSTNPISSLTPISSLLQYKWILVVYQYHHGSRPANSGTLFDKNIKRTSRLLSVFSLNVSISSYQRHIFPQMWERSRNRNCALDSSWYIYYNIKEYRLLTTTIVASVQQILGCRLMRTKKTIKRATLDQKKSPSGQVSCLT